MNKRILSWEALSELRILDDVESPTHPSIYCIQGESYSTSSLSLVVIIFPPTKNDEEILKCDHV